MQQSTLLLLAFPRTREPIFFVKAVTAIELCLDAKSLSIICTVSRLLLQQLLSFHDSHFSDGLFLTMEYEFVYFYHFSKTLHKISIQEGCQDLSHWGQQKNLTFGEEK